LARFVADIRRLTRTLSASDYCRKRTPAPRLGYVQSPPLALLARYDEDDSRSRLLPSSGRGLGAAWLGLTPCRNYWRCHQDSSFPPAREASHLRSGSVPTRESMNIVLRRCPLLGTHLLDLPLSRSAEICPATELRKKCSGYSMVPREAFWDFCRTADERLVGISRRHPLYPARKQVVDPGRRQ